MDLDLAWREWRTESKRRIDLRDLIGQLVRLQSSNPAGGLCPFHDERSPSFKVWQDHYHCYGCEAHGDVFDWLESIQGGGFSPEQALEQVERLANLARPDPKRLSPPPPTRRASVSRDGPAPKQPATERPPERREIPEWVASFVGQATSALLANESPEAVAAWAYLECRGLASVAEALGFGVVDASVRHPAMGAKLEALRGRLVIPSFDAGTPVFFKARYIGPKTDAELKASGGHKYDGPPGRVSVPFNGDGLSRAAALGFVLLVEGELDAASVLSACGLEYPVLGLPGGRLPQGWAARIAESGVRAFVLMDPDEAGIRHAVAVRSALEAAGVRTNVLELADHEDLNLALQTLGPDGFEGWLERLRLEAQNQAVCDLAYLRSTFLDEADARFNRPYRSFETGIEGLDRVLDGGFAEGLHILGGITGGGKTSLALWIALHNALAGRPVLYASFEQSRFELWARLASRLTHVAQGVIKRGAYLHADGSAEPASGILRAAAHWPTLEQAARHLRIVEGGDALSRASGAWSLEALSQAAIAMKEAAGAPPLVIVDYLQRVPGPPEMRLADPRERVSYVAGALQVGLARSIGCPVLALSSVSRASYRLAEADLEGRLAAFKEAGELEYTAYTALLLYGVPRDHHDALGLGRPSLHKPQKEFPVALDLVKNREGERKRLIAAWKASSDEWRELGHWAEGDVPKAQVAPTTR